MLFSWKGAFFLVVASYKVCIFVTQWRSWRCNIQYSISWLGRFEDGVVLQAWNFIFKRARPFLFCKGHFHWKIFNVNGELLKGHQGQDKGHWRPWRPLPACNSEPGLSSFKVHYVCLLAVNTSVVHYFQSRKKNYILDYEFCFFESKNNADVTYIIICGKKTKPCHLINNPDDLIEWKHMSLFICAELLFVFPYSKRGKIVLKLIWSNFLSLKKEIQYDTIINQWLLVC